MMYQRVPQSSSCNPPIQEKNAQFTPGPFVVQARQNSHRLPTQAEIENKSFNQNKFEAFGLQIKEKHGNITPVEQERLGVLQAKMDEFWAQRAPLQSLQPAIASTLAGDHATQANGNTTGDRPDLSMEHPNKTGMPNALKTGIESLSRYSLDDVRVHYNSPKPAQLQALAYTQGTEIHVAPGQEKHLPHEAWHVVQQKQGRVKSQYRTMGVEINGEEALEREADVMGDRAMQMQTDLTSQKLPSSSGAVIQNMTVIQMVRSAIAPPGMPIDLAGLAAAIIVVDREIAELREEGNEITLGFIDIARINAWREQFDTTMTALGTLNPGAITCTQDEITGQLTPIHRAFRAVIIRLANMRGMLNKSLTDYNDQKKEVADLKAETTGFKSKKPGTPEEPVPSPYRSLVDTFDKKLDGAVVIVEGNFVVVLEHYQLKHNSDLGILQAGGPFKGAKGSQLSGGWDAHKTTYAPQVLAHAKKIIAAHNQVVTEKTTIVPAKARLGDIDAYLTIARDGNDWIINYHGNPPD
jgi:hypothetical protein